MTENKVRDLLNTNDFDLEQEVLMLICGLSTFTDKSHDALHKQYNVDYEVYDEKAFTTAYINLYNDVEEIKKKLK